MQRTFAGTRGLLRVVTAPSPVGDLSMPLWPR
jgi:hypothetical protein